MVEGGLKRQEGRVGEVDVEMDRKVKREAQRKTKPESRDMSRRCRRMSNN